MPFRGVSEYHLDALEAAPAKLIIVPSAHNFADEAFARLLDIVDRTAATLLFTGPLGLDAYWREADRLADTFGQRKSATSSAKNGSRSGTRRIRYHTVTDGSPKCSRKPATAAHAVSAGADRVMEVAYGLGRLIWCPLPVELNERAEPVAALYAHALEASGVRPRTGMDREAATWPAYTAGVFVSKTASSSCSCPNMRMTRRSK